LPAGSDATSALIRWLSDASSAYGVANLASKALPALLVGASGRLKEDCERDCGLTLQISYHMEGERASERTLDASFPSQIDASFGQATKMRTRTRTRMRMKAEPACWESVAAKNAVSEWQLGGKSEFKGFILLLRKTFMAVNSFWKLNFCALVPVVIVSQPPAGYEVMGKKEVIVR